MRFYERELLCYRIGPLPYKHRASQRHKFILVAIPFFILAGELMGGSGILSRLLDFAKLVVGRVKGALLHINILVSMFFGGINGSAIADTSAVGSMMIKATDAEYKDPELAAAVTAVSSVVGPIIPPSLPMLIYAFAAGNVSIAGLFIAGIIPGVLIGLSLLIVTIIIVRGKDYPLDRTRYGLHDVLRITRRFLIAAVLPFIMVEPRLPDRYVLSITPLSDARQGIARAWQSRSCPQMAIPLGEIAVNPAVFPPDLCQISGQTS